MTMPKTAAARTPMDLLENMFGAEMSFMKAGAQEVSLLAKAFHADVVIHEPASLPYAGVWKGLEGIASLFRKMSETFSDMRIEDLKCAETGDTIFVACTLCMTSRETGISFQQPFAEVLRFEDGLLREGTPFYYDTVEVLAALQGGSASSTS